MKQNAPAASQTRRWGAGPSILHLSLSALCVSWRSLIFDVECSAKHPEHMSVGKRFLGLFFDCSLLLATGISMSRARRKQADLAIALYHKGIHQRKPGRGGTGVDSIAKPGLDRGGASVWPLLYQRVSLGETAAKCCFQARAKARTWHERPASAWSEGPLYRFVAGSRGCFAAGESRPLPLR